MEIEITQLLQTDMFTFSHSCAEGGENAGQETWDAALNGLRPLLKTSEEFEAFRDFVKDSGGWSEEEIAAWDENELQALFLQWVAGDTREAPARIEGVTIYEKEGEGWFYDHEDTLDEETGPFETRTEAYQDAASAHYRPNCYQDAASAHYRPNCYPSAESLEEIDWQEYEAQSQKGRISGRIFKSDDGKIYFHLGC